MKILIYSVNFAPELTGIGKFTGDLAAWLAAEGHDVRVVTTPPYYPAWAVWQGYKATRYSRENWHGVTVFRTPLWMPQEMSGLKRMLYLASFAVASVPALLAQWRWKPEVVWLTEPPLFCAPGALLFARLCSAKTWLHVQDFEVDAAFELGLLNGRRLRAMASAGERWLMRRFDRVSTISSRMLSRATGKGIGPSRLVHFPNWADLSSIQPLKASSTYRTQLGLADDAVVALYSGNMGRKQGFEVLAEAAALLQQRGAAAAHIHFVFCGNGPGRADLEARCIGNDNVQFLDLQPMERLGDLLGLADIHLLPQRANAADLVMPSKLTGMLSSGRPVIASARPDTELGMVASQFGMAVPPEDAAALADAIEQLAAQPEHRARLGAAARLYAETRIDRDAVLRQFERDLYACVGRVHASHDRHGNIDEAVP